MSFRKATSLPALVLATLAGAALAMPGSAMAVGTSPAAARTPSPTGIPGNWTAVFDDEFSSTSLDTTIWQPNWLAGNNTDITKTANSADTSCADPAQVTESGGYLNLAITKRRCTANDRSKYQYAGALVNTHNSFTFTYGAVEARIYLPPGAGTPVNFPAWWTDGTGQWPTTGEMDVMEVLKSCGPGVGFHFHSPSGGPGGCAAISGTGWHIYAADWEPGSVTYYYDGVQVGTITAGITNSPMYLILNNVTDKKYGGPDSAPQTMQVDYVRVWQNAPATSR